MGKQYRIFGTFVVFRHICLVALVTFCFLWICWDFLVTFFGWFWILLFTQFGLFLNTFWMTFSQKGAKGQNSGVLIGFYHFWKPTTAFAPDKRPKAKMGERRKTWFPLRAPNSDKHKHLGTFLDPKTPKIAFSTFGPTSPFWSVPGIKSAPDVKMSTVPLFPAKNGESHFCDSGRKGVPKTWRL